MYDIKEQLITGLKDYLNSENEQVLTDAYELGRSSMKEGVGALELIVHYHEALADIGNDTDILKSSQKLGLASTYLTDVLAPFEIRQRGYKDLISKLNRKNLLLEEEVTKRKNIQQELKESKDKFQSLIENALDIITVLNYDGSIRYSSPSVKRILAYDPEELKGRKVLRFIHPDDISKVRNIIDDLNESSGKVASAEFRFQHNEGGWVILESVANSVVDSQDGLGIIVNSRDITYRIKFRRELEEKSRQLEEAQHIAHVGSWEWNVNAREKELVWSKEMFNIYSMEPEEFDHSYQTFKNKIHPGDRPRVVKLLNQITEDKEPFSFEHRIITPDGSVRKLFCKGQVITDHVDQIVKLVGICQDITEQKETEDRLREYSEKLRKLSAKMEQAREEERIRIAREIHDELGQMLTVLKMEFSIMIDKVIQERDKQRQTELEKEKELIINRVDTILKSVQRIATDLRPEVLDDLGLAEAIEWQAQEFENRTGIKLHLDSRIDDSSFLEEEYSTAMFRIFQETLTNVARHAQATEVHVNLFNDGQKLTLKVSDNGIGISSETVTSASSLGIIGMKERVELLGGNLKIDGALGEGTTILLEMPIDCLENENQTENTK